MSVPRHLRASFALKVWVVIRFIVFGIGGFIAVWISCFSVIFGVADAHAEPFLLTPYAAIPVCLVGALMMLFGAGQWRRWAYLWVFVSVPIVVTPLGLLAGAYPQFDSVFPKPLFIVFFVIPMPISYSLVRSIIGGAMPSGRGCSLISRSVQANNC